MKAVKKFKQLLVRKRPELMEGIFGRASRIVQPPLSIHPLSRSRSTDTDDRRPVEGALTSEGVHRDIPVSGGMKRLPEHLDHVATFGGTPATKSSRWADRLKLSSRRKQEKPEEPAARKESGKGQAHNPLEDTLFLGVGAGGEDTPLESGEFSAVSESPGAVDVNVYEKAYQEEIEKILANKDTRPMLYLTRRVEGNKDIRDNEHITDYTRTSQGPTSILGFKKIAEEARANVERNAADSTKPFDDNNDRTRSE
jgi:[calcium/calmodulin-dependent protein kinase] kinase